MTPFIRMAAIITVLFITMKIIVLAISPIRLRGLRLVAFFFWPGMRPATFLVRSREVDKVRRPLIRGIRNVTAGALLFAAARLIAMRSMLAAIIIALPAFSLMLHFGLFSLATAFWRTMGFEAEELFRKPWQAKSLAEFWSRRWNVGFSDMIAVAVHRPLAPRFGRRAAILVSFIVSALLHELAISVPAAGGYGLPSIYFALHGVLVASDVRGRAVTLATLIAPLPLLFHPPFIHAVITPLLR